MDNDFKLAIFGFGGHAREVAAQIGQSVIFFVDDKYVTDFCLPISEFNPEEYFMMVAVAEPEERKKIVSKLPKETKYFTFVHPTAQIMSDNIEIGVGSFIGANSILTTNIKIGDHAILNRGNHIGHDTVIGNYFSSMPGAIVSGNVIIGDNCYLGTNSSVREKIIIVDNVKVGSNSTVVKNIKFDGVYAGVPVKQIKK